MMKKEFVLQRFKEQAKKPLSFEDIAEIFSLDNKRARKELKRVLDLLIKEGEIVQTRTEHYALPEQLNLVIGRIKKNKKGFGFLISENPDQDDLFISAGDLNGAQNQDQVIVRVTKPATENKKTGTVYRAEGKVIRILDRARSKFIGTLYAHNHYGFVVPDDTLFDGDIFVPEQGLGEAKDGDKVVVEIKQWPERKRNAEGRIVEVVGKSGEKGIDVLSIIYQHNLEMDFSPKAKKMAASIPQTVDENKLNNRYDIRFRPFVTIDGIDAKDLDDAVHIEKLDNGHFLLFVSIADVGEYVIEDSALDIDAFKRGTSVYLVDRVLPMLPTELSNGICSLNPGVDRLVLTCTMEIDGNGKIIAHEIFEAVINSSHRMTYDEVNEMLNGDKALIEKYSDVYDMILTLNDLRKILHKKRVQRGSIDFDLKESYVKLNDNGEPVDVGWKTRGDAEKIIEECMLVANETVAEHYFWLHVPFIYRVHEAPEFEKLNDAREFLYALGYTFPSDNEKVNNKAFQKILNKVHDETEAYSVNMVLLRSMKHAYYSTDPVGHFGLGAKYYSHFTSPIRRYSDLSIHRVIKEMIYHKNRLTEKRLSVLAQSMAKYAERSSLTERIAEEAERDSVELKKVEFMLSKEGEIFSATIVSVVSFGFFVQLDNSIEGLVHISTMVDDFYQFYPATLQLVGENSHKVYELGQRVTVQLIRANIDDVQLDFELVADNQKGDIDESHLR